jgi:hypothetical protein
MHVRHGSSSNKRFRSLATASGLLCLQGRYKAMTVANQPSPMFDALCINRAPKLAFRQFIVNPFFL